MLQALGWSAYFADQLSDTALPPARVVAQHQKLYRVHTGEVELAAEVSGKLRHRASELPVTGDWVLINVAPGGDRAIIQQQLERKTALVRKAAGSGVSAQVLAANVDRAIVAMSLDQDFSVRRIERYLVTIYESGAAPAVVLTKADAAIDVDARRAEVERVAIGVPVLAISARTGLGIEALRRACFAAGETVVLLGSSGAGKSTLINTLAQEALLATSAVRESDQKGRHTTTHRELFTLPGGALVIDTPGLRELQLWDAGAGLAAAFPDVEAFAAECRFRDCTHSEEPGCAVILARDRGALDADRFESYLAREREEEALKRRLDPFARAESKRHVKAANKSLRRFYREKDRPGE